jgi:imidazolonepropionase-like amidohydrolase
MRLRYGLIVGALLLVVIGFTAQLGFAQDSSITVAQATAAQAPAATSTLFENVRVFSGTANQLSAPANVLVVGNTIQKISTASIAAPADVSLTRIKGNGQVLMPGLIDAHAHLYMATASIESVLSPNTDPNALEQNAQKTATDTLMRGFTSVRDLAGPVFNVKRVIDAGQVPGPRIYPSGAMISQTSGHGDYRSPADLPRAPYTQLSHPEIAGGSAIADGVDQVLRVTREQLMKGATQIKLAAGGGVASNFDPLDVSQFTEAELHAAVEAAEDWNT